MIKYEIHQETRSELHLNEYNETQKTSQQI